MTYTPTVWAPGNRIMTSDAPLGAPFNINRIENGIDDIYNNAMTFLKNKKFINGIRLTEATGYIEQQLTAAERYRLRVLADSNSAVFDDRLNLGLPLQFDDKVELSTINSVAPELHGTRHNRGGVDYTPQFADVIVSVAGGGGEFNNIASAISVLSVGEVLMIRDGTFTCTGSITMPAKSTLIGQGDNTLIDFSNGSINFNSSFNDITVRDIAIRNSYNSVISVISLSGNNILLDNVKVNTNYVGVSLGGSYDMMKDCRIYSTGLGVCAGAELIGTNNRIIGCLVDNFYHGVSINSNGSIVSGNLLKTRLPGASFGLYLRSLATYSLCLDNVILGCLRYSWNDRPSGGNHIVRGNIGNGSSYNADASTTVVDNLGI